MAAMILLVGEQPAPNLLPLRHYAPAQIGLVHTQLTQLRAKRLADVIGARVVKPMCETEAYRVDKIRAALDEYVNEHKWAGSDLIFNLSGGTKAMVLAAYEAARQLGARAFYYQTEGNQSTIHPYRFDSGSLVCENNITIAATLTLDDYLRLYVGEYQTGKLKDPVEKLVEGKLRQELPGYEFMSSVKLTSLSGGVEVDLLARCGNQVAAIEIKRQADKKGIDQLNGVTDQRTLGTYTRKILISAAPLESNNAELARAYRITVITLPSALTGELHAQDADQLVRAVRESLEPKS